MLLKSYFFDLAKYSCHKILVKGEVAVASSEFTVSVGVRAYRCIAFACICISFAGLDLCVSYVKELPVKCVLISLPT